MGKIVKYCSSCEEGFAEKFAFCPDCGASLQAFEMNPVTGMSEPEALEGSAVRFETEKLVPPTYFNDASAETAAGVEPVEASDAVAEESDAEIFEPQAEPASRYVPDLPSAGGGFYKAEPLYADEPRSTKYIPAEDDGFHVTVVDEGNTKQRNVLLLSATLLMVALTVATTIGSLFNKAIGMDAIGDERSIALLVDQVPMDVEEEVQQKKDKDGGGGGGGGREEEQETSQGDLADQSKTPTRPPDVRVPRANFDLVTPPPQTEGDRKFEKKYDRWGDPNSKFLGLSNGTGSGGGQGSGTGTGQGSGSGTGAGSGSGSGSGGGNGSGNGDGAGPGSGRTAPPPPSATAVTTPVRFIATPKAMYTDEARTNNVTGAVRLKITLLASGEVGSITPVTRLPHGLTEKAIAAARQIRFEPKKVNGVPQSVIITREYTFTIY